MRKIFSNKTQRQAFTLAEVLITLGIIGIVSAITMPTLISNHKQQTYMTTLHKVYNETHQALTQLKTDKNVETLTEAGLNSNAALADWAKKYFKVQTDCGTSATPCFAPSYKHLKGATVSDISFTSGASCFQLPSGASIRPYYKSEYEKKINLFVDTNGAKGPNILGRDAYLLGIYNNGTIDDYDGGSVPLTPARRTALYNNKCNSTTGSVWGCFGNVLNNGWK